ncbi:MAG TPA: hypothetical protein VGM03_21800 [Phycisphaerae bacterium]|jgi:hypothetical protein
MAEVEVARIGEPAGWEPYLSVEDATKLDRIQAALKAGDTTSAAQLGKVYRIAPLEPARARNSSDH